MLRLWLLGPTRLEREGRALDSVLTRPKRLALLAYLAASPGYHRRDSLLALFWPELDTPGSRDALNQALRYLRKELGGSPNSILVSRGNSELGIERRALWCDAVAFREAMDAGRYADALDLYRGDLLAGFHVGGADGVDGFDAWLDLERSRYRDAAARAALEVADAEERAGRFSGAIIAARRATDLAGLDERVVRGLLARLARLGDRAGALRTYEGFASRLARDLEVEPAAETKALIEEIRRRDRTTLFSDDEKNELAPRGKATPGARLDDPAAAGTSERVIRPRIWRARATTWRIAAAGAIGLTTIAIGLATRWSSSPSQPGWFTIDPPADMSFRMAARGLPFALSRDGRAVAFVVNPGRQLMVRRLHEPHPVPFPRARVIGDLHFSPDGRRLAFQSSGDSGGPSVIRIDNGSADAEPTRLATTRGWSGISWTWSDDVVYTWNDALWRVPPSGGPPVMIARMDTALDRRWRQPTVLRDGRTIALRVTPRGVTSPGSDRIVLLSIDGGAPTRLDFDADGVLGYFEGALVYSRLSDEWDRAQIMAVRFDLRRRRVLGKAMLLVDSVDTDDEAGARAAISENGTLALLRTARSQIMQILDTSGGVLDEHEGLRWYNQPVWSPDGGRIAVYVGSGRRRALAIYDVASRVMTRIPGTAGFFPSWTADGNRVVYTGIGTDGIQRGRAMWVPVDGSRPPEPIPGTEGFEDEVLQSLISPDTRHVLVRSEGNAADSARAQHAFVVPMGGGRVVSAIPETPKPWRLALSPDGKWIAYHVEKGRDDTEVFVRRFPGGAGQLQISTDSGWAPRWSGDGRKLYYRTQSRHFRVATLDVSRALPRVLRTDTVFADRSFARSIHYSWDVDPTGTRFAVTKDLAEETRLRVIPNWSTVLRKKLSEP